MVTYGERLAPRGAAHRDSLSAVARSAVTRAVVLLAAAALCLACGPSPATRQADAVIAVVDDAGRTIELGGPARRVISLIPAQTEIITLLAGSEVLVARTRWDIDPALAELPSIGNALTPSVEWLAARRPDLVIAWPDAQSRDVVQRLSDVGIPVYASRVESIAEIRSVIERLGVLLGHTDRADSLIATIDAQLDSVRSLVAGRPRPAVLYLLNVSPPMAAGPGTFVDELIGLAGGTNVFSDLRQLWPQVSLEEIVRRQPDVIIRPSENALADPLAGIAGQPGWRELAAVRERRVYGVSPYFYNRPGAGVGEAARGLAERIHARATDAAIGTDTQERAAQERARRDRPVPGGSP